MVGLVVHDSDTGRPSRLPRANSHGVFLGARHAYLAPTVTAPFRSTTGSKPICSYFVKVTSGTRTHDRLDHSPAKASIPQHPTPLPTRKRDGNIGAELGVGLVAGSDPGRVDQLFPNCDALAPTRVSGGVTT